MAIEKGLVITAIETKYKGKGLSKTFINGAAAKIAENLDSEDDIEGKLTELDFLFTSTISEADRRVTDAVNKVKTKTPEKKEDAITTTTDEDDDPEVPAYMKKFMKRFEGVENSLKTMQDKETVKSITERFHADPRLKGLSPKILKGYLPATDDDFESAVETAADELKEFISDEGDDTTQQIVKTSSDKPRMGVNAKPGGKGGETKPATKEELDKAAEKLVI